MGEHFILVAVMVFCLLLLLVMGTHVMVGLGLAGAIGLYLLFNGNLYLIEVTVWNVMNNPVMIVIPLFVFMGNILLGSGLSKQLFEGAQRFVGWLPGGLCHVQVFSSAIFAAISGSSVATLTAIGSISLPEGERRGYHLGLFLGSLASGATLGVLIPPSVIMIMYAVLTGQSIGRLFVAGFIPGVTAAVLFMIFIAIRVIRNPSLAPKERAYSAKEIARASLDILPSVVLIVSVLGGIYSGLTTANEAAAVGVAGALVLATIFRGLSWQAMRNAFIKTATTTAMVMFLVLGATMMSNVLGNSGVTHELVSRVIAAELSRYQFLAFVVVLYIIMGMLFDSYSVLVLSIPLLFPVSQALGIDAIWFGVMVTILLEAGLVTPPFGINLFVLDGMVGGGKFTLIARACLPFVFLLLMVIGLMIIFPDLALWLPKMMRG